MANNGIEAKLLLIIEQLALLRVDQNELQAVMLRSKSFHKSNALPTPGPAATDPVSSIRTRLQQADIKLIPFMDLEIRGELGRGSFGVVYAAYYPAYHKLVAVKRISVSELTSDNVEELITESKLMRAMACEHVVGLRGVCVEPGLFCIVTALAERGSLFDILHRDKKSKKTVAGAEKRKDKDTIKSESKHASKPPTWSECLHWSLDIANGLLILHANNVVHRDIKSANIVINAANQALICDFGLSKMRREVQSRSSLAQAVGTLHWMAPELWEENPHATSASDMYALGIVMYEMFSGDIPFYGYDLAGLALAIATNERAEFDVRVPAWVRELISRLWDRDPAKRPSAKEVIAELERHQMEDDPWSGPAVATVPKWCHKCKVEYHEGITCEKYQEWCKENGQADEKFEALLKDKPWKKCPGCQNMVEKLMGNCNHIVCLCKTQFCYVCGARVDATSPYDHFNLGKCRLFDEAELREDDAE